jgi:hypothetical protein
VLYGLSIMAIVCLVVGDVLRRQQALR